MSESDVMMDMARRVAMLEKRLAMLERLEPGTVRYKATNLAGAVPTNAELDALFGDAATKLFNGFIGVVHDTAGASNAHICVVADNTWHSEILTQNP